MAQKMELTVTGEEKLHCASCEQRVRNALHRLPGVQDAGASALSQRVVVTIDLGQLSPQQVQAKLKQIGYEVTPKDRVP